MIYLHNETTIIATLSNIWLYRSRIASACTSKCPAYATTVPSACARKILTTQLYNAIARSQRAMTPRDHSWKKTHTHIYTHSPCMMHILTVKAVTLNLHAMPFQCCNKPSQYICVAKPSFDHASSSAWASRWGRSSTWGKWVILDDILRMIWRTVYWLLWRRAIVAE